MKNLYLFDICGTIYRSNTTFDFLEFYLKENKCFRLYRAIYKSFFWKIINRALRSWLHYDLTRILALRFLKGTSYSELSKQAKLFTEVYLSQVRNIEIYNTIEHLISIDKSKVLLVSATIDVVAEAVADSLHCEQYYSTALEYKDGACTGKMVKDLLGNKCMFLNEKGILHQIKSFFTDDLTDADVLEYSEIKNIVCYPKTRKRWIKLIAQKKWEVSMLEY